MQRDFFKASIKRSKLKKKIKVIQCMNITLEYNVFQTRVIRNSLSFKLYSEACTLKPNSY